MVHVSRRSIGDKEQESGASRGDSRRSGSVDEIEAEELAAVGAAVKRAQSPSGVSWSDWCRCRRDPVRWNGGRRGPARPRADGAGHREY